MALSKSELERIQKRYGKGTAFGLEVRADQAKRTADSVGKLTDAERRIAFAQNEQNNHNNRIADQVNAARERFRQGQVHIATTDPGRMGKYTNERILADESARQLKAHEMAMLEKQRQNDLAIATEKKLGMIGQGSEAAKANADAQIKQAQMQHGYYDQNGVYHEGSLERVRKLELTGEEKRIGLQNENAQKDRESRERIAAGQNQTNVETSKIQAQGQKDANLAQMAMQKYKVDETNAAKIAIVQKELEGKTREGQVNVIKAAVASGGLDPKVAEAMMGEITGGNKPAQSGTQKPAPKSPSNWKVN